MKYSIGLLFFTLVLSAQAQLSDSLGNYYYYVNQAEELLVDGNFPTAERKYEEAFTYRKRPFGRDEYNYGLLEVKLGSFRKAYPYLEDLVCYGFKVDEFKKLVEFDAFFEVNWGRRLETFDSNSPKCYNKQVRFWYDSLLQLNQDYTQLSTEDSINPELVKMDSSNSVFLKALLNKYGFPSEELVGIHENFSYSSIKKLLAANQHREQKGEILNTQQIINEAITSGKLNNRSGAEIINKATGYDQFGYQMGVFKILLVDSSMHSGSRDYVVLDSMYAAPKKEERLKKYDLIRSQVGLPRLEESIALQVYQLKNEDYFYFSAKESEAFKFSSREQYEELKKLLKVIVVD